MSPVNRSGDFILDGKPYMLARGEFRGRAWRRTGYADTPGGVQADLRYGGLPGQIDHVEVWDDWSGGFGHAYRTRGKPNTVHWSENMDTRFPRQMVHCQEVQLLADTLASPYNRNIEFVADVPWRGGDNPPVGAGAVIALGLTIWGSYAPTHQPNTPASAFNTLLEAYVVGAQYGMRPAIFGSYTYVARPDANSFVQRYHAGTSLGDSEVMPGTRSFTVAGNRLWRAHSRYLLQSCAAGASPLTAANWSATLSIGGGDSPILDMVALGDQVYVGMPDGLYAGDQSGTFYNVLAELRNSRHADNCRHLEIYNNGVLAPHIGGLYWFRPSDLQAEAREIGPVAQPEPVGYGRAAPPEGPWTPTPGAWRAGAPSGTNRSPVVGHIRTLDVQGAWIHAGLWTGSQSYLMAAREVGGRFDWHVMQRLPHVAKVHRIHLDGITTASNGTEIPTRVWVATEASFGARASCTAPLYCFPVPRGYQNSLAPDPTFTGRYVGSARVDLGLTDFGAPATSKTFRSVEIWADSLLSGAQYADVYYTVDTGARTLLGRAQTSPKSILYFDSTTFVTGQNIALGLESFTASVNTTPIYRAVLLHGVLRPSDVDLITAVVRCADNMRDRQGGIMRPAATMLSDLRALATANRPYILVDLAGATNRVAVLTPVEEQEYYQGGADNPEILATVKMAIQIFS